VTKAPCRRDYIFPIDTPPPELDQSAVAKKFAQQFEAAENLRAYAWTHRPRDRAGGGKVYRSLLFAIFARATLTYRAILHLCRGGYTEQADMLTRSLLQTRATFAAVDDEAATSATTPTVRPLNRLTRRSL